MQVAVVSIDDCGCELGIHKRSPHRGHGSNVKNPPLISNDTWRGQSTNGLLIELFRKHMH